MTITIIIAIVLMYAVGLRAIPYKLFRWLQSKPTQPAVGQKWVFADLSPRWPPHSFEITEITADKVIFVSNWIPHEPDHGFKKLAHWNEWARKTRSFPL